MVGENFNQVVPRVELDLVEVRDDFSLDIRVDKGFGNLEMFSEDIQFPVTADETDDRDRPFGDVIKLRDGEFFGE